MMNRTSYEHLLHRRRFSIGSHYPTYEYNLFLFPQIPERVECCLISIFLPSNVFLSPFRKDASRKKKSIFKVEIFETIFFYLNCYLFSIKCWHLAIVFGESTPVFVRLDATIFSVVNVAVSEISEREWSKWHLFLLPNANRCWSAKVISPES